MTANDSGSEPGAAGVFVRSRSAGKGPVTGHWFAHRGMCLSSRGLMRGSSVSYSATAAEVAAVSPNFPSAVSCSRGRWSR
jgi:hypothetical protein